MLQEGIKKYATVSNFDGEFSVSNITGGAYSVEISFVGWYETFKIEDIFETFKLEGLVVQDGRVQLLDDVILIEISSNTSFKKRWFFQRNKRNKK